MIKALLPFNNKFRVLALTATPGSNMQAVRQVSVLVRQVSILSAVREPCQGVAAFFGCRNKCIKYFLTKNMIIFYLLALVFVCKRKLEVKSL